MSETVELRALRGFKNGVQFVRQGATCRRSEKVAADLVKAGYAVVVPTPPQELARSAAALGVTLVVTPKTLTPAEVVKAAHDAKATLKDERSPKPKS